jgi:hypothetical protein
MHHSRFLWAVKYEKDKYGYNYRMIFMAVNSKQKGNSGERSVAKMLSEALGGSFVRSISSGAFVGGKNAHRKNVLSENQIINSKGDIVPPDNMKNLVLEIKSYKAFRYHQIFSECLMLDGWIAQTKSTADQYDFWMLIFKANRMPWSVVFDAKIIRYFKLDNYAIYNKNVITDLKIFLENNRSIIIAMGEGFLSPV